MINIEAVIFLIFIIGFGFFCIGYAFGYRSAKISSQPLIDRLSAEINKKHALCKLKACEKFL